MAMRTPAEMKGQLKSALAPKPAPEPRSVSEVKTQLKGALRQPTPLPKIVQAKAAGDLTLKNETVRPIPTPPVDKNPIAKEVGAKVNQGRHRGYGRGGRFGRFQRGRNLTPAQRKMMMLASQRRLKVGSALKKPIPGKPVKTA